MELGIVVAAPLFLIDTSSQFLRFAALLLLAAYCFWRLSTAGARDGYLRLNWRGCRSALPGILLRSALAWLAVFAAVALLYPSQLLYLPQHAPGLTVAIVCGYALVSVLPQEVAFRGYASWRLESLNVPFVPAAVVSGAVFGWVHILYGSWLSVLLSFLAGTVFYRTYRNSRSLAAVWLEHSLFGSAVFVLGLGHLFYRGPGID
ncbi:CPBP family intramembrane glutamic endopeptidase [Pelagibius sp.]|uniref:CPBP family intramembrane glutamic endopeptidase n=1 Tax=Pelagibius sp. TaxID=1931238 RepID=UPI0026187406|nr:CPBP family intramembrane glutamic endopeptidase [Pelagibius sp.]